MVDGSEIGQLLYKDDDEPPTRCSLLQCPACFHPILVEETDYGAGWEATIRLYPPRRQAHFRLPPAVRLSCDEAIKCFSAKAFIATVVMCRRTLESVCHHYIDKFGSLEQGIEELGKHKVIDGKLIEWADALRRDGNLAVHDPDSVVEAEDASDLLGFTEALLEYVFILQEKFEEFKKRRAEAAEKEKKKPKSK